MMSAEAMCYLHQAAQEANKWWDELQKRINGFMDAQNVAFDSSRADDDGADHVSAPSTTAPSQSPPLTE